MSTKTIYKRIALVAVATLGAGLLSVAPASATTALPSAAAISLATSTNIGTTVTGGTFVSRTSFSAITLGATVTSGDDAEFSVYLLNSAGAVVNLAAGGLSAVNGDDDATAAVKTTAATVSAAGSGIFTMAALASGDQYVSLVATTGDLAAGTYTLHVDADTTLGTSTVVGTIVVIDAAAPKSVKWASASVTEVSATAVDYAPTFTVLDTNGAKTVLLNNEQVTFDVTPQTGVVTSQVGLDSTFDVVGTADAASATQVYTTQLNGNGTGTTGSTVAGTEYVISATLQDGTSALAAPISTKYKRVSNTSSLTGSIVITSDAAGLLPITTTTAAVSTASANFYAAAKDANGGAIKGATVSFTTSAGTLTGGPGLVTDGSGLTTNMTATPAAAGTITVTATIATGAVAITQSITVVTSTGSTLAASNNNWDVVKNNGTGVAVSSTAPATNTWDVALNVTSLTATLTGLTPNSAVKLTVGGNATTPKVSGVTGSIYPTTDAAGKVSVILTVASATNGQNITLGADTGAFGGDDSTLTLTFATVATDLTTTPLASSLNMAKPSETKTVTAAVEDQYGNPVLGGTVRLTNTVVPSGVTAQTASTIAVNASGVATLTVALGSVLGTYTYTVTALDPNGGAIAGAAVSTITYSVTTTGIAATLTLTDNDTIVTTELTSDNKSTRQINVAPAVLSALGGALTENIASITVATTSPAALGFVATATNGIRLFTTTPAGAVIGAGKSSVTGIAGTTTIFAVPTKVGAGTITVVSGGLTKEFTLTGALAATVDKANIVTLTATANAGQYEVKVTDIFGNGVVSDVSISLAGPGSFSNGFKNLTATTGADGINTFSIVSDGSAVTTITALLPAANYNAITAAEALASSLTGGLGVSGATTDKATATMAVGATGATSAVDAATAAAEAAEAAAQDATDAALDATTAAEAAGALAQEAVDLVTELSAEVTKLIAGVRASITYLTKLVMKLAAK